MKKSVACWLWTSNCQACVIWITKTRARTSSSQLSAPMETHFGPPRAAWTYVIYKTNSTLLEECNFAPFKLLWVQIHRLSTKCFKEISRVKLKNEWKYCRADRWDSILSHPRVVEAYILQNQTQHKWDLNNLLTFHLKVFRNSSFRWQSSETPIGQSRGAQNHVNDNTHVLSRPL